MKDEFEQAVFVTDDRDKSLEEQLSLRIMQVCSQASWL